MTLIAGNHNFDIDFLIEQQLEKNQFNVPPETKKPRILENEYVGKDGKKKKVLFLDLNINFMYCLHLPNQENCRRWSGGFGTVPTYKAAREYAADLVGKLLTMRHRVGDEQTGIVTWRVIRSHNPLFNPEIDMTFLIKEEISVKCTSGGTNVAVKQNFKALLEDTTLANKEITCEYNELTTGQADPDSFINLKKAFRKSRTDFWLASHYHAAMLLAYPWKRPYVRNTDDKVRETYEDKRKLLSQGDFYNSQYINISKPDFCLDRTALLFSTIKSSQADNIQRSALCDIVGGSSNYQTCVDDEKEVTIKLNKLDDPSKQQDLGLFFVIGNSGRFLDPLKGDLKSNADIVWARSKAKQYYETIINCESKGDDNGIACNCVKSQECQTKIYDPKTDSTKDANAAKAKALSDINAIMTEITTNKAKNYYGYAHVTFTDSAATVEFREKDPFITQIPADNSDIKVVKKFKLTRDRVAPTREELGKSDREDQAMYLLIKPKPSLANEESIEIHYSDFRHNLRDNKAITKTSITTSSKLKKKNKKN